MGGKDYNAIKAALTLREALGIICFSKHHHRGKITDSRLSEILKVPVNKIRETIEALKQHGIIDAKKAGYDTEIEFVEQDDEKVRHIIDEVIWEQKQEYGKIYKKLITAELLDFMSK